VKLSRRAQSVQPSPTLAITARAKAMQAAGADVISLSAGEPDFGTPEHVRRAGIEAIESGFTRYTATAGTPELRRAIAEKHRRENDLSYDPATEVVACVGAKHAIYGALQVLVDEGDEVLVPAPYWVSYPDMTRLAGGTPVFVPCRAEDGFVVRASEIEARITERTAALILNSPSNPTGAVYPRKTLEEIAEVVRRHPRLVVISDDIYEHLIYTGEAFANLLNVAPDLRDRTVVVNGLSKSFSMTGWRIGWALGPREVIGAMQRLQDQSTSNPTSITQAAAVAALSGGNDFVVEMRKAFDERRRFVQRRLSEIPGVTCPEIGGAFYAFFDVRPLLGRSFRGEPLGESSARFCEILLEEFHVAMVPGVAFGAEGFVRLSFATSLAALENGLDRLEAFARALD
jgi:aspartate aminotransferase